MVYNFEVKARAIYMYAGNKSSRKTAKEIGCSKSIVCKWARDADNNRIKKQKLIQSVERKMCPNKDTIVCKWKC